MSDILDNEELEKNTAQIFTDAFSLIFDSYNKSNLSIQNLFIANGTVISKIISSTTLVILKKMNIKDEKFLEAGDIYIDELCKLGKDILKETLVELINE